MGIRLTGISTPLGGVEWEYNDKHEKVAPFTAASNQKIKVFISSICGDKGKFDNIRAELKKEIESTKLAQVYLFEAEEASTLSAENHYVWALEDSDVCIFLIDNADGVTSGVQKEIDTVNRCNIKSLYYFCDETTQEKTPLEQSIMGAKYAKSKTVHKFEDLSKDGSQALINDIVTIYLNYCKGRLVLRPQDEENKLSEGVLPETPVFKTPAMPKSVIGNIDKCKEFILSYTLGFSNKSVFDEEIKTGIIDEWGEQFLHVLFNSVSIRNFNVGMLLEDLKQHHDEVYFAVVYLRWQAIQAYFLDDTAKCMEHLEAALELAKDTSQPKWVIQDILVDLRNVNLTHNTKKNTYSKSAAQNKLSESDEIVNYPVLDRINESLQEKYINGLYKKKLESPHTITLGNDFNQYGELLASSYIVAVFNGSLTHILLFYNKVRDFVFYLACKYDDWRFRKDLLKYALFAGNAKEIKGIQNSYPEVLNEMTEKDAKEIMEFCNNHPILYRRVSSQMIAFGTIGYYLNDSDYRIYEKNIINIIREWLNDNLAVVELGNNIFACLDGIAYRMSQDTLAELCCLFIDRHYARWYDDMFRFIARRIHIDKMDELHIQTFIQHIISLLENENDRKQISHSPLFLCTLRKQNQDATELLDKRIKEYLSVYYENEYRLETTNQKQIDYTVYMQKSIDQIRVSNDTQGKNGCYFGHGTRDIATVRAVLLENDFICPSVEIDALLSVVADTLLISKEDINIKLDAVALLICIVVKYPERYIQNRHIYESIISRKDDIFDIDNTMMSSNIDKIALIIAIALLEISMGNDSYIDILEGMSYIRNDIATSLSVANMIIKYLELDEKIVFPQNVESVILQNVLQWLQFEYLDLKWQATRILLMLSRNHENVNLINQKIIDLIDTESVYIKNLILQNMNKIDGISKKTREYVYSKCINDECFVVRKVCAELMDDNSSK